MNRVTLENFRCFRERQTARLAPLTLLVGENSTGKTSFLALIQALRRAADRFSVPDFKEEPYDLGSFDEIAHHRGGRGGRADSFEAGFDIVRNGAEGAAARFDVTFGKQGTAPVPVKSRFSDSENDVWIEQRVRKVVCPGSDGCETRSIGPVGIRSCHGRKPAYGRGCPRSRWERRVTRKAGAQQRRSREAA